MTKSGEDLKHRQKLVWRFWPHGLGTQAGQHEFHHIYYIRIVFNKENGGLVMMFGFGHETSSDKSVRMSWGLRKGEITK